MTLTAYIDGASRGNPGESGYGVVLKGPEAELLQARGVYIGRTTNNVAEYRGLLGCLQLAAKFQPKELKVYSDSQLLVNQINGIYKVRKPHLQSLHTEIITQIKELSCKFKIEYIPREKNREADTLARRAVNLKTDVEDSV